MVKFMIICEVNHGFSIHRNRRCPIFLGRLSEIIQIFSLAFFPHFSEFSSANPPGCSKPPPVPARSHRSAGHRPRWWVPGIQGWDRTWRSNRSTRCRQRHCLRDILDEKMGDGWEVEATSEILEWFIAGKINDTWWKWRLNSEKWGI